MDSLLDRCKDTQTEGLSMKEMERLLLEEKQKNAKLTEELDLQRINRQDYSLD